MSSEEPRGEAGRYRIQYHQSQTLQLSCHNPSDSSRKLSTMTSDSAMAGNIYYHLSFSKYMHAISARKTPCPSEMYEIDISCRLSRVRLPISTAAHPQQTDLTQHGGSLACLLVAGTSSCVERLPLLKVTTSFKPADTSRFMHYAAANE